MEQQARRAYENIVRKTEVAEAREVSEGMCRAAAECLADQVSPADLEAGSLFPPVRDLRRVALRVAEAVVREARDAGLGRPLADDAIPAAVAATIWDPCYPQLSPRGPDCSQAAQARVPGRGRRGP